MIAQVVLNPNFSSIEHSLDVFNKSILNPVTQAVQQAINQQDLLSDLALVALKTLQQLLKIVFKTYEVKYHQTFIQTINALL